MTVKILLDPHPYHPAVGAGTMMYAAAVPRVGDHIRVDNQLNTESGRPFSGLVKYVMHHVGPETDDPYVVVGFEPLEE